MNSATPWASSIRPTLKLWWPPTTEATQPTWLFTKTILATYNPSMVGRVIPPPCLWWLTLMKPTHGSVPFKHSVVRLSIACFTLIDRVWEKNGPGRPFQFLQGSVILWDELVSVWVWVSVWTCLFCSVLYSTTNDVHGWRLIYLEIGADPGILKGRRLKVPENAGPREHHLYRNTRT